MADILWKLNILRKWLLGTFEDWKRDVWKEELDSQYCCDGRECGCGGATVREIHSLR